MKNLIAKIEEAKIKTGLSNPELSIKLGHSRKYLTNLVNDVCTTELQKQLIEELDQVIAGTFKMDAEVIAELTQRLAEAQDINTANIEIKQNLSNANNELNAELNTMRKNAQEADRALKQAKDDLDYIKEENDQLREAIEFAQGQFSDKCNENYILEKTAKHQKQWTLVFMLLTLVLSALLWFK